MRPNGPATPVFGTAIDSRIGTLLRLSERRFRRTAAVRLLRPSGLRSLVGTALAEPARLLLG
ncbi:hypothetical protein GCM10018966_020040 [Streptomyces yanii]